MQQPAGSSSSSAFLRFNAPWMVIASFCHCVLPSVQSSSDAATPASTESAASESISMDGSAEAEPMPDGGSLDSDVGRESSAVASNAGAASADASGQDGAQNAGAVAGGRAAAGAGGDNFGASASRAGGETGNGAGAAATDAGGPGAAMDHGTLGGALVFTAPLTMGKSIPTKYKCPMDVVGGGTGGGNLSPPLSWTGGALETKSFAVVLYDVGFNMLHWVLWDIPAANNELPEGLPAGYELSNPEGAHQAASMGEERHAYYGPCTGGSLASTYEFRLYALNVDTLDLTESSTALQALTAVEGAMLEKTVWSGMTQ